MHLCLNCQNEIKLEIWRCHHCHWTPKRVNNFLSFAPNLAIENDHFNAEGFKMLASLEDKHFWFRTRVKLIHWAFKKYFSKAVSFLEIGCGTGYILSTLQKSYPNLLTMGSDIHVTSLPFAEAQLREKTALFQMDARDIPFSRQFDVIGSFDVLEHIEEDEKVIQEMYKALKPGGGLLLTVPQHPKLWSPVDEVACHKRRYKQRELQEKLTLAGFKIKMTSSFIFFLLPLMLLSRINKYKKYNPKTEVSISPVSNFILEKILGFELLLIKWGVQFPIGGSRFVVAIKEP